ncbi:hypothetical protein ACWD3J_47665 [Streptomyces sp. NPDC002755]
MFALGLREELKEHDITITTLMPGATDSDFHARAGMDNTAFGTGAKKNSRKEVARQGFLAMMEGRAEIVGGDAAIKRTTIEHRFLPETYKAAHNATKANPAPSRRAFSPVDLYRRASRSRFISQPRAHSTIPQRDRAVTPRCL